MFGVDSYLQTPVFKSPELQKSFSETGIVKVNLPESDTLLKTLIQLEKDLGVTLKDFKGFQNENANVSFHSTFLDKSKTYKKTVIQNLTPLFEFYIDYFLIEYKIIQLNIFNKLPNSGFVSPHQNLTTVDEEKHTSFSFWIPLQNTDEVNGCLFFSPSSNKKFEPYRNPYICWPPLKTSSKIQDYKMIPFPLKFGQALIFDDSIIHASPDNLSTSSRVTFHCITIPKTASPVYTKKNGELIEVIEVDDSFWHFYSPGEKEPEGKIIRTIPYKEKAYSLEDLITK